MGFTPVASQLNTAQPDWVGGLQYQRRNAMADQQMALEQQNMGLRRNAFALDQQRFDAEQQQQQSQQRQQAIQQIGSLAQRIAAEPPEQQRQVTASVIQNPAYLPLFKAAGIDPSQLDVNSPDFAQHLKTWASLAPERAPTIVPKGSTVLDPNTHQPIYTAPPEEITPYQKADLALRGRQQEQMTPYQRAQIGIEQRKLTAAEDPLGLRSSLGGSSVAPGGAPGGPAAPANLPSGDEFLAKLPPNIGSQVKALADGRMAFPGGMALKTPYWQQMLQAVSQYDPNFDAVNYNARAKTRSDFTSGKNAQNIKSLNTAIGHLGTLDSQIGATASHGLTPLNYLQNAGAELTGSAGPTQFKQTATALASELTQVFRGSGGAEADVKRYLSELNPNASLEQKKAAINNIVDLLQSRLAAIGDQYNQGMGKTEDPLTLLNPKAQNVIKGLAASPTQPTAPHGQAKSQGPMRMTSPQEALALPPGTVFVTPDGRQKIR